MVVMLSLLLVAEIWLLTCEEELVGLTCFGAVMLVVVAVVAVVLVVVDVVGWLLPPSSPVPSSSSDKEAYKENRVLDLCKKLYLPSLPLAPYSLQELVRLQLLQVVQTNRSCEAIAAICFADLCSMQMTGDETLPECPQRHPEKVLRNELDAVM